jgi:hypothetical protein
VAIRGRRQLPSGIPGNILRGGDAEELSEGTLGPEDHTVAEPVDAVDGPEARPLELLDELAEAQPADGVAGGSPGPAWPSGRKIGAPGPGAVFMVEFPAEATAGQPPTEPATPSRSR